MEYIIEKLKNNKFEEIREQNFDDILWDFIEKNDDVSIVKKMINEIRDNENYKSFIRRILCIATELDKLDIIKLIVEDTNTTEFPTFIAIQNSNLKLATYFFDHSKEDFANVEKRKREKECSLSFSHAIQNADLPMIKLLVERTKEPIDDYEITMGYLHVNWYYCTSSITLKQTSLYKRNEILLYLIMNCEWPSDKNHRLYILHKFKTMVMQNKNKLPEDLFIKILTFFYDYYTLD